MRTGKAERLAWESDSEDSRRPARSDLSTRAEIGRRGSGDPRLEVLRRSPAATRAYEDQQYDTTSERLQALIERGGGIGDKAFVAKFAMTRLDAQGVSPKLGGSFASYLQGAKKIPADVDIEVSSSSDLDEACRLLTGKFEFRGERINVEVLREIPRRVVQLEATLAGSDAKIGIDVVNENSAFFNRDLVAPRRTGSPSVGTVDSFRLVVNAIDRWIDRPHVSEGKRDSETVYNLLKGMGYHPSSESHRVAIREQLAAKIEPDMVDSYMRALESMLREHRRMNAPKRSDRRSGRRDSDCVIL